MTGTRFFLGSVLVLICFAIVVGIGSATLNPTVGPNVNVTKASGNQAEGTIAVNPTNPNQLFVASNPGATARRSTDGGATWVAAGAGIPASCCDNVAAWDSFGNLFLVNINAALNAVVLYLSTDGGANFTTLQTIDTGSMDQPTVKAGAGSVWVTWNDGTIKARGASVTGLGAANIGAFTAEQAAPDANTVDGQFGDIAIGPTGQVAVTYQSDTDIYVNTDADGLGAGGFGAQVHVTSTNVAKFDFIPAQSSRSIDAEANLAWDRSGGVHNGRLYLVYTDETPDESNNTDVDVRFSDDNGATWSSAVTVNDDGTTRSQFLPNISVDQTTGDLAVTWHDARNDPGNNNTQFFGAVSDTGGASFGANFQISTGTSDDDTAGSGVDYGDYTWADSFGHVLHPVWSDNSNSTGDNPDGTNTRFDIYTAAIAVKTTPTLTTTAPATSLDGQPMFDTALLTGGVNPGGSVTFTVYGPNDATCSNPPAFPPTTTPVSGNGSYASAPVTPFAKPGLYRWVASYSGDIGNNAVTTVCGAANETVNVQPAANLTITKTDDAPGGHVLQGQQLTYTIGVSNSGPDPAENVQVTDTLPATTVFAGASPGCVNAAGTVTCSLGTVGVGSGSAKSAQIVVLLVGSTTPITNSATVSTTTANTNPIHTATDGTIVDQACTTTLTGKVAGSLVVPSGEALCLNGATVGGSITVRAGGALTSNASTINGSVSTTGARALTLCATTVSGAIRADGTVGMVRIGDDDYTPVCAGGKVGGSVSAQNNQGGVELFGNTITGSVLLSGNHGASPLSEDKTPEVEANTVSASLSCTSNIPGVTNGAQPNTVHGASIGQCVGL